MDNPGYELDPDGRWIKCLTCGSVSYNPGDIENLYCGKCGCFHEDREIWLKEEPNGQAERRGDLPDRG